MFIFDFTQCISQFQVIFPPVTHSMQLNPIENFNWNKHSLFYSIFL